MYRKILIPTDGSEASRIALEHALLLAAEQRAEVRVIHVYEPSPHTAMQATPELRRFLREEEEQVLEHAADRARALGVRATTATVDSAGRRPADVIVSEAVATAADLIAIGTHGHRGIRRMLLGSVAQGVAQSAMVPVLLIREHAGAMAGDSQPVA